MTQKHISFYTNIRKSQITENENEFLINDVPITVDGAVMNGLLYRAEDNKAGMKSMNGKVVTLSHPTDEKGNGMDAYNGKALQDFYSGGNVEKTFLNKGTWYANLSINKNMLQAQDKNQNTNFYKRLQNKEDIGVSTGLYLIAEQSEGEVNGIKYNAVATEQQYNHLAMLESSEPPAGGDATFMRFNADGEQVQSFVVNIDEYTTMPETELKRISVEIDETSLVKKLTNSLGELFTKNQKPNEEANMTENMKNMVEALKKNGMYKDGMSEDAVKNAYDKMMKEKEDGMKDDKMSKNASSDILAAVNALREEVGSLKAQLNAKENAERDQLIAKINALNTGFESDDLQGMTVNALKNIHDRFQPQATFGVNSAYQPVNTNSLDDAIKDL